LILGIAALLAPIAVASKALRRDGVVMLAVAVVFAALAALMPLGRTVGGAFVAVLGLYVWFAFRQERVAARTDHGAIYDKSLALQEVDAALIPETTNGQPLVVPLLIALGGLVLVVLGGRFLVEGAVSLARALGIAETVIGLTIVAVGTSMPELVTSAVAGLRRQGDVAFGNIVGSNIYNILGIGGFTALIAPGVVPFVIVSFDNLVMIGVSAALLLVAWTGFRISRLEGLALLAGYAVYVYLIWP